MRGSNPVSGRAQQRNSAGRLQRYKMGMSQISNVLKKMDDVRGGGGPRTQTNGSGWRRSADEWTLLIHMVGVLPIAAMLSSRQIGLSLL